MNRAFLKAFGIGVLLVLPLLAVFGLKKANTSLRDRIAGLTSANRERERLQQENERMRELLGRFRAEDADAQSVLREQVLNARRTLATEEQNRRRRHEQQVARAAAAVESTDPERGMTRLDHFKNVGRTTPIAALQTVVWAVIKQDDAALASAVSVTGAAREKAEALLARLPPAERAKFPSPESLAAVAIAGQVLRTEAMEVKGFTFEDASHGMVTLRLPEPGRPENTKEGKVPLQLGPSGWQVVVPERAIDGIVQRITGQSAEAEKK